MERAPKTAQGSKRQWGLPRCQGVDKRGRPVWGVPQSGGTLTLALKDRPNGIVRRDILAGSP